MEAFATLCYTGLMNYSVKRACSRKGTASDPKRGVWMLAIVLLVGLTSMGLWMLSAEASGSGDGQGSDGMPSAPDISASARRLSTSAVVSEQVGSYTEAPMGATGTPTYTLFLPQVYRDYWEIPDSLLGAELFPRIMLGEEAIDRTARMGAKWVRVPLFWSQIENSNSTPEDYNWDYWDYEKSLTHLSAEKVQVILTLIDNPSWAATYPQGPIDLVDISELVEFMVAAVEHYGQPPYNVKYWEFYNEPDNGVEWRAASGCWGYFGNEPEVYAQLLEAVYLPMKAADPEAQIVFGGMAYDWWTSEGGPFVEAFLDGVLDSGGGDHFDVMNFHYYPAFRSKWDPYGPGIIGKATYIRGKLASHGVEKPLICTEASMWSDEARGGSEELQSRYVPQVFARSMAANLKTTIWFWLVDADSPYIAQYGLLKSDLSFKPAYYAYQTLARQLAWTRYVQALDATQTGSEQIEAYEFAAQSGSTRILVAWTKDEQQHEMWLVTGQVVVVGKYGHATTVHDGDDGQTDGRVRVIVGPSPVYLRFSG